MQQNTINGFFFSTEKHLKPELNQNRILQIAPGNSNVKFKGLARLPDCRAGIRHCSFIYALKERKEETICGKIKTVPV